jgi:methionyl-tRNA formyltransferase
VFQLVPELDAGDVFGQFTQPIGSHETAGHLLASLSDSGAELLARVVDAIADGEARSEPQVGDVTLAPKLTLADGNVDFTRPAHDVVNLIRGVTPEPGAFTTLDGARLKILDAAIARDAPRLEPGRFSLEGKIILIGTATDPVQLVTVHPAGRKAMAAGDWWRGRPADAAVVAE